MRIDAGFLSEFSRASGRGRNSRAASKDSPNLGIATVDAWDLWIRRLTAILKQHRYNHRPPRCPLRTTRIALPRFPLLVCELQKGFPAAYRRGTHSPKALESAIGRASSGRKRPPKSGRLKNRDIRANRAQALHSPMVGHELGENTSQTTKARSNLEREGLSVADTEVVSVLARPHCTKRSRAGA